MSSALATRLSSVRRALQQGDRAGAIKKLRHLVRGPVAPDVAVAVARALVDLGAPDVAVPVLQQVLPQIGPEAQEAARIALARAHNLQGRAQEALLALHPLLSAGTARAEVWAQVGWSFVTLRDRPQALTALQQAVALDDGHGEAWLRLGGVLADDGYPEEAARAYLSAARALPGTALPYVKLGFLQFNQGRLEDARHAFERALHHEPGLPAAVAGLALVAERDGDLDAAYDMVAPLVEVAAPAPMLAVAYATTCRRLGRSADALPAVERALQAPHTMSPEERTLLLHGRADLLDALGRVDDAFAAYRTANTSRGLTFDADRHAEAVRQMLARFAPGRFEGLPRSSLDDPTPVLIVGMPRSGTSLVEQILASHPHITGAGELEDWRKLALMTSALGRLAGIWYADLDQLTPALMQTIGERYLSRLGALAQPGAVRVTDKMPSNVLHLGLVAMACPGARIIHCTRDPRDVGWSVYRQQFHEGLAYATDLRSIGVYSRATDAAMAHWKQVLPLPIHTVVYEDLVDDLEGHARDLCGFVDVPFDPACLAFHENTRHVPTASYAQVTRRVYRSSVGRFAPYAAHLGPLLDGLEA